MKLSKISATSESTTSSPTPEKPKSSRKKLFAVVALVLIVLIIVGVYAAATLGGNNKNPTTPTASPTASGSTPSPTASSGASANVGGASSLQYSVTLTNSSGGSLGTYTYSAKDIGTSNMAIRIEFTDPSSGDNMVYIVNGATQQAWAETNGAWTDLSTTFSSQFTSWKTTFADYQNNLSTWSGIGDYTYTAPDGSSVRIFNVSVNPTLQDSLFTHS